MADEEVPQFNEPRITHPDGEGNDQAPEPRITDVTEKEKKKKNDDAD